MKDFNEAIKQLKVDFTRTIDFLGVEHTDKKKTNKLIVLTS